MLDQRTKFETVTQPTERKRRPVYRWWLIGGIAVLVVAGIAVLLLVLNWPFKRQTVIEALQESSGGKVELQNFHSSYFPPGFVADQVNFGEHQNGPPLIAVDKLMVRTGYFSLITAKRLDDVHVTGMHINVPPKKPDGPRQVIPFLETKSSL